MIPVNPQAADEDKPGWIVDGQQRTAAIREARISSFPMCVTAFITDADAEQRAQFILVNSTKPLPKGLIHELLPSTGAPLPLALHRKRLPALLLERLNYDADSPLRGRIRTPTSGEGTIKDNSILKMMENSISDGALYPYRFSRKGGADTDAMLAMLKDYWTAVSQVFRDAWELPPRRSRLTHGARNRQPRLHHGRHRRPLPEGDPKSGRLHGRPRISYRGMSLDIGNVEFRTAQPAQMERPSEHSQRHSVAH